MYDNTEDTRYVIPSNALWHLDMSIFAEQVFCSIVTEMHTWSKLIGLALWPTLDRANQATSYHRNVAVGHMRRLLWHSDTHPDELLTLIIAAMVEAKAYDRLAEQALTQLDEAAALSTEALNTALKWHRRRKRALKYAALELKAIVPPQVWEKGVQMAQN